MRLLTRKTMDKQSLYPRNVSANNTVAISHLGVNEYDGISWRADDAWGRRQVFRDETFSLVTLQEYSKSTDDVGYTRQEGYVKFNFWLSGKHITVLNGYGQYQHEKPEVFATSGPQDMIKMDLLSRESETAVVALCLLGEFFPRHMSMSVDELPPVLRAMLTDSDHGFAFNRFPFTQDLIAATRAILAAPCTVRRDPLYARAKAVELMCLLIHNAENSRGTGELDTQFSRHKVKIDAVRELLLRRYAEPLTLDDIAREVGLNRMTLTAGFRQLFGASVHDFLQNVRMERAYELLQDEALSVSLVAEAVGYSHPCNFSTAFRAHFGCAPRKVRSPG